MEENIYCNFCFQNPHEFTILLCDHVICSRCLQNNLKKHQEISMIKCKCGLKTYCNQNSMRLSTSSPSTKKNVSSTMNNVSSISNFKYGFPQFDKNVIKKGNFCQKSLDSHQKRQKQGQNSNFLKTEPLQFDQQTTVLNNSSVVKVAKYSNSQSQQMSGTKQNKSKYLNQMLSSTNSQENFSKNLTKQLKFLNIQYEKAIQQCKENFNKVMKNIQTSYMKVVNGIKRFCLEQIVQTQAKNIINLPYIVNNKYEFSIGKKICQLNEYLLCTIQNYARKASRNCRPTVHLQRELPYKQSKSKDKRQQNRQIYLTLSPKWKSPNKQVFIKFIQKQKGKNKSKGNLVKKVLKTDKVRIY